jgi:uncharacterized protein (TIGR02145 family)
LCDDKYGFAALPGGNGGSGGGFGSVGTHGVWWSTTEYNADGAYYRLMDYDDEDVYKSYNYGTGYLYSVRCVKD